MLSIYLCKLGRFTYLGTIRQCDTFLKIVYLCQLTREVYTFGGASSAVNGIKQDLMRFPQICELRHSKKMCGRHLTRGANPKLIEGPSTV